MNSVEKILYEVFPRHKGFEVEVYGTPNRRYIDILINIGLTNRFRVSQLMKLQQNESFMNLNLEMNLNFELEDNRNVIRYKNLKLAPYNPTEYYLIKLKQ